MNAKCLKCGEIYHWRNQRGAKMPKFCTVTITTPANDGEHEERLTRCGGELVLCDWEGNSIVRAPQPKRRKAECAICGRKAMLPGRLSRLEREETFLVDHPAKYGLVLANGSKIFVSLTRDKVTVPAGTIVCWHHESYEKRAEVAGEHGYDWRDREPYPVFLRPK
jgi:hypothetical protein